MGPSTGLGLIAGAGRLPLEFALSARRRGIGLKIAAIKGAASPRISSFGSPTAWFSAGQLGGILSFFKDNKVARAVMHGKVEHSASFKDLRLDWKALVVWNRLKDRSGPSILRAVASELSGEGVRLLDERTYMEDLIPRKGWLTRTRGSAGDMEAARYGLRSARVLSRTRIGQSLIVKRTAVVAVEASEGTDEAIRRAGKWAGAGTILVKVASPRQDWRFDVPTLGPGTVRNLVRSKARGLVMEAGRSFLLEPEKTAALADKHGLFILAV